MTADERIGLIRVKIERAKKHIDDLDISCRYFFSSDPYKVESKSDPKKGQRTYHLVSAKDIPPDISPVIGDILQNLRSALDHMAFQLFKVGPGGQSGGDGKHIYFPIFDGAAKYKSGVIGKVRGMRQNAIDAIQAVKAYKGGNEILWRLHALNNLDKHRLLITAVSSLSAHSILPSVRVKLIEGFKGSRPGDPIPDLGETLMHVRHVVLKAGDILLTIPESEVEQYMQFRFIITFAEPGIIEGEPIIETLQHMADLVDNIVSSFGPLLA